MSTSVRELVPCNLCAGTQTTPWAQVGPAAVVRCQQCGLVYTNPRPVLAALTNAYEEDYGVIHQDEELLRQRRASYRREVAALLRRAPGGRFLDVGCGTGEFISLLRDQFEVHGVDVSASYVHYGRDRLGLSNLRQGQLSEVAYPAGHFDVVQMRGVIQHLPDPLGEVREAFRVTRPGGLLVISATPNIASLCARLYRDRFRLLAPDQMLYDFAPATLRALLAKAGYRVERLAFPYLGTPYWRWWQGLQVARDAFLIGFEQLTGRRLALKSPAFFGNMMTCYARKPSGVG